MSASPPKADVLNLINAASRNVGYRPTPEIAFLRNINIFNGQNAPESGHRNGVFPLNTLLLNVAESRRRGCGFGSGYSKATG
jgi:hypothetical protein